MPRQRQGKPDKPVSADGEDRLYGLPLEQFVKQRDELARRLRQEGRRDEAAQVAKLRKPALAAWGANQALRSQPGAARELRAAGSALADTQRAALRGRATPRELRDAIERHRAALERMMAAARGLLTDQGHSLSPSTLERVSRTLAAASLDPVLAQQAQHGRLEREHFYSGLDELTPAGHVAAAKAQPQSTPKRRAKSGTAGSAPQRRRSDAARRRREAQLKAARRRLADAEKAARTAEEAAKTAAKARDVAAKAAQAADAQQRAAEGRHARALEARTRAQAQLDALEKAGP